MRRYIIEVMLKKEDGLVQEMCFPLPDTSFIVVTSYQNVELIRLKVENNPFAKGAHQRNAPLPSTFAAIGNNSHHVASGSNTIGAPPLQPLFTVGNPMKNGSSMMMYNQHLTKRIQALAAPQRKTHTHTP